MYVILFYRGHIRDKDADSWKTKTQDIYAKSKVLGGKT